MYSNAYYVYQHGPNSYFWEEPNVYLSTMCEKVCWKFDNELNRVHFWNAHLRESCAILLAWLRVFFMFVFHICTGTSYISTGVLTSLLWLRFLFFLNLFGQKSHSNYAILQRSNLGIKSVNLYKPLCSFSQIWMGTDVIRVQCCNAAPFPVSLHQELTRTIFSAHCSL